MGLSQAGPDRRVKAASPKEEKAWMRSSNCSFGQVLTDFEISSVVKFIRGFAGKEVLLFLKPNQQKNGNRERGGASDEEGGLVPPAWLR